MLSVSLLSERRFLNDQYSPSWSPYGELLPELCILARRPESSAGRDFNVGQQISILISFSTNRPELQILPHNASNETNKLRNAQTRSPDLSRIKSRLKERLPKPENHEIASYSLRPVDTLHFGITYHYIMISFTSRYWLHKKLLRYLLYHMKHI